MKHIEHTEQDYPNEATRKFFELSDGRGTVGNTRTPVERVSRGLENEEARLSVKGGAGLGWFKRLVVWLCWDEVNAELANLEFQNGAAIETIARLEHELKRSREQNTTLVNEVDYLKRSNAQLFRNGRRLSK